MIHLLFIFNIYNLFVSFYNTLNLNIFQEKMHDGNVLQTQLMEKNADGTIQRAHLMEKKKKPDGIGWQCPLHHICFHFDTNILFSV